MTLSRLSIISRRSKISRLVGISRLLKISRLPKLLILVKTVLIGSDQGRRSIRDNRPGGIAARSGHRTLQGSPRKDRPAPKRRRPIFPRRLLLLSTSKQNTSRNRNKTLCDQPINKQQENRLTDSLKPRLKQQRERERKKYSFF